MQLGGIVLIKTLSPFVVWIMTDGNDQYYALDANRQIVLNTESGVSNDVRTAVRDLYEAYYGTMTYAEEQPESEIVSSSVVGVLDANGTAPINPTELQVGAYYAVKASSRETMGLGGIVYIVSLDPFAIKVMWDGNNSYYALDNNLIVLNNYPGELSDYIEDILNSLYNPVYGNVYEDEKQIPATQLTASQIVGILKTT